MPYVVLPPADRAGRLGLAESRWAAMVAAKPELAAAVALQRRLIGPVIDLAEQFEHGRVPRLSLPQGYLTKKLRAGIPALTGEPIQVPVDAVQPTLLALVRALAEGGGGEATLQIRAAVEENRIDPGALLALGLRREQAALRVAATRAGLGHDLLWLVTDLAVGPFAHALLGVLFENLALGSPLGSALEAWDRGYCPLCGSWPVLVEDIGGRRTLRCSFCAAAWVTPGGSCLYCTAPGERVEAVTLDPAQPGRIVENCGACRGYVKVIPAARALPFPLLALADLDSMDLDLAAMQRGFARPAIRQFARR